MVADCWHIRRDQKDSDSQGFRSSLASLEVDQVVEEAAHSLAGDTGFAGGDTVGFGEQTEVGVGMLEIEKGKPLDCKGRYSLSHYRIGRTPLSLASDD